MACFFESTAVKRRSLVLLSGAALAAHVPALLAQPNRTGSNSGGGGELELLQLVDKSLLGHDIARDFAQGARCYLQDLQSRGRPARMRLRLLDVDFASAGPTWSDSPDLRRLLSDSPVVFGAYGDAMLRRLLATPAFQQVGVLAAPITQDPRISRSTGVLAPFATLDQEIDAAVQALKNTYFLNRLAVVYAQPGLRASVGPVVLEALKTHGLQAVELDEPNPANLPRLAPRLAQADAPVSLFLGGAPELATLVQSMGRSGARRMVVGTSMVDARAAAELRVGTHGVGIMLSQPVPNPLRGRLPVVSELLGAWSKFYDEQVTPMSLAGFMTMKWLVQSVGNNPSADSIRRMSTSAERASDAGLDIGGFVMRRQAGAKAFVELLFLREDGRLVS